MSHFAPRTGRVYVRIVIDRQGKMLSTRLEQSSGFPDLDREAVALAKPSDDKSGDTIELVVPVEFTIN